MIVPKIIGLCGYPLHGKSTAQRFLTHLGVEERDDSEALRAQVMERYGLTWEDVNTQTGKRRFVMGLGGETMTVRKLLGDYGQIYGETPYGPNYWVDQAIEQLARETAAGRPLTPVSYGSLRRSQATAVKAVGGFVVAIQDPRGPMSTHYFDEYDYDPIDVMVMNDGSMQDLNWSIFKAVTDYLQPTTEQMVCAADFF